jgi:hypothetical protein
MTASIAAAVGVTIGSPFMRTTIPRSVQGARVPLEREQRRVASKSFKLGDCRLRRSHNFGKLVLRDFQVPPTLYQLKKGFRQCAGILLRMD